MTRLPLRIRVAAAFALAMAVVLAVTGVIVYVLVGRDLDAALDRDLRLRAQDLSALVEHGSGGALEAVGGVHLVEAGENFAQLLDPRGRVVDATPTLGREPLLPPARLRVGERRAEFVDVPSVPGLDEPARLLATPVERGGKALVLVVGATRENRAEALRSLRTDLLIAGPIALVLATALGYFLAGSGLRVVETMRRRAAAISADRPGERLPVPPTGDELQRLAETLNEMLERLEEALERERSFVADAGHELRTPLALLRAELDFALHHAEGEDELREALRAASEETDRLVQLSADLLLIASAEGGKVELCREPILAGELLSSVRNRFLWRANDAHRPLQVDDPGELRLDGDKLRLEQALGNLVDNALRHGTGAVHLHALRVNGHVELHVRDDGAGFPDGFLGQAFERFSRPAERRSSGGSGLGLAIVSVIAKAHGGGAEARNVETGGSDVWISVPAAWRGGRVS
jgi:two-component system OmpR family sensor kinase